MVKKISDNYHIPYFTISPTFSICPIHGYLSGEHEYCPKCDAEIASAERMKSSVSDDIIEAEEMDKKIDELKDNENENVLSVKLNLRGDTNDKDEM